MIRTEEDIIHLVKNDEWMMKLLTAVKHLDLPDWWMCAGFVRAKVWDTLHDFNQRTETPDIDVIYFDEMNIDEKYEKDLEEKLSRLVSDIPWSVKNEARMHVVNDLPPYTSSVDAISKFPETATALGVKLDEQNQVILTAPCGIGDVLNFKIRPTPYFTESPDRMVLFEQRIIKKNWRSIWPKVHVHTKNPI